MTQPARRPAKTRGRRATGADAAAAHARLAAQEAVERRGQDVVLLDLRALTAATDFFVIATGESDVQVRALADRVEERLREENLRPWHVEGLQHAHWVLLDYVDFVVHVFHREARSYYDLERLWADAPSEAIIAQEPRAPKPGSVD